MINNAEARAGQFCWVDLAASNVGGAQHFYEGLFGWTAHDQRSNGGVFTRLRHGGRDVGSAYQLSTAQLADGVPSHWTPYVRVDDVEKMVRRAVRLGGDVLVKPFAVAGLARIALVLDAVGAPIGLWQPLRCRGTTTGEGNEIHG